MNKEPIMQYSEAKRCAESLILPEKSSSCANSVFLIASALSLIVQTARFVEEKAQDDPSLGKLSLVIFAKTKTQDHTPVNYFRLWGARLNTFPASDAQSNALPQVPSDESINKSVELSSAHLSSIGKEIDATARKEMGPSPEENLIGEPKNYPLFKI